MSTKNPKKNPKQENNTSNTSSYTSGHSTGLLTKKNTDGLNFDQIDLTKPLIDKND